MVFPILMKKERSPSDEELKKLLDWFHPNSDAAAEGYMRIHTRLMQIFASRGCAADSEMLADEVINRVAVRIDVVVTTYPDAPRCCLAFVENVHREYLRDKRKEQNAVPPPPPPPPEVLEIEDQCLKHCLETLEPSDRDLFERYFEGEGRARIVARQKLAEELNLTPNALRIQAHRIRKKMRKCMEECIKRADTK